MDDRAIDNTPKVATHGDFMPKHMATDYGIVYQIDSKFDRGVARVKQALFDTFCVLLIVGLAITVAVYLGMRWNPAAF